MIRKWVKMLPYWVVFKIVKRFGADFNEFNGRKVCAWRIDKGEFLVWDIENYTILRQKEREARAERMSKKRRKYEELKREFENDE